MPLMAGGLSANQRTGAAAIIAALVLCVVFFLATRGESPHTPSPEAIADQGFAPSDLPLEQRCRPPSRKDARWWEDAAKMAAFYGGVPEPTVDCDNDGAIGLADVGLLAARSIGAIANAPSTDPEGEKIEGLRGMVDGVPHVDILAPQLTGGVQVYLRVPEGTSIAWMTEEGNWIQPPRVQSGFLHGVWMRRGREMRTPLVRIRLPETSMVALQPTLGMQGSGLDDPRRVVGLRYLERVATLSPLPTSRKIEAHIFEIETVLGSQRVWIGDAGGRAVDSAGFLVDGTWVPGTILALPPLPARSVEFRLTP